MPSLASIPRELAYLGLIFGLIVVPRALQRFRIPAPLTSFGLGMLAAALVGVSSHDATLTLLAALGVSSLFLFAGLELDVQDLHRGRWPLLGHLLLGSAALLATTQLAMNQLGMPWNAGALLALALWTPSTGFILESLPRLGLSDDERYWVSVKAVGAEVLALLVVFVVLQSDSREKLLGSSAALLALLLGIPFLFRVLGRVVLPHAPGAEFSLLVMVGLVAAYITNLIGVHFLLGAFLAGFIAKLLRRQMPKLASDSNLHAISLFASFFVPFYFFFEGLDVPADAFTWEALKLGLLLTGVFVPIRIALVWTERRFIRGETAAGSLRVATALTPTLIFTLVLATILRERFHIEDKLYCALLIYAGLSTILPSLVMAKPVDFMFVPQDLASPATEETAPQEE